MPSGPENMHHANAAPDEEAIIGLLGSFKPQPSQAYYQKMNKMPWMAPKARKWRRAAWRASAAIVLLVILSFAAPSISPSFNVVAQRLLQFFSPATSDTTLVRVTVPSPDTAFAIDPDSDLRMTIEQVERQAAFSILAPKVLPADLTYNGGLYQIGNQQAYLYYKGVTRSLLIIQQPMGVPYQEIGASAQVAIVDIGSGTGEYAIGGWVMRSGEEQSLSTAEPGSQVSVEAYWDNDPRRQTLQWQVGEVQVQIIGWGEFDKNTLIEIAANIIKR